MIYIKTRLQTDKGQQTEYHKTPICHDLDIILPNYGNFTTINNAITTTHLSIVMSTLFFCNA